MVMIVVSVLLSTIISILIVVVREEDIAPEIPLTK